MRNNLLSTGLVLLALCLMQACGSAPKTPKEATAQYRALKTEITEYKPVGDAKIDGLAKPFVTSALQLRDDVSKESALIEASPLMKYFGGVTQGSESYAKIYGALSPTEKKAVDEALAASSKADQGRLDALLSQVKDLATAGGRLAVEISDAAKGGGGGAAGIGGTILNAASGPGAEAAKQVKKSIEFCPAAEAMISNYRALPKEVSDAISKNVMKAQS